MKSEQKPQQTTCRKELRLFLICDIFMIIPSTDANEVYFFGEHFPRMNLAFVCLVSGMKMRHGAEGFPLQHAKFIEAFTFT
jgi:hypothetical protein